MLTMKDVMILTGLKQQGLSNRVISPHTGHDRKTDAKYLKRGLKSSSAKFWPPKLGKLYPCKAYLKGCLDDDPLLSVQRLLRAIKDRCYDGGYSILATYFLPSARVNWYPLNATIL